MYYVTKFVDSYNKSWLADGTYPKTGFKKKHRETKTMTFIRKKKIIWFMVLVCFISSIASAEARAYPVAGSNATTFFVTEKAKGEDDSKLLYMCGFPCCGTNYHGPCSKCCRKGIPHTPETPMKDGENPLLLDGAGNGGHGGDNGHN